MSRDRDGDRDSTRVYVGGLSEAVKKEDLELEFEKFGKLTSVWVAFNPPGFAFIEFSSHSDAETACDNLNGTDLLGSKIRVEIARGKRRGGFRGGGGGWRRGGSDGGYRSRGGGGGGGGRGPPRYDSYGSGSRRGGSGGGRDYRGGDSYSRNSYGSSGGGGGGSSRGSRYRSRSPPPRQY